MTYDFRGVGIASIVFPKGVKFIKLGSYQTNGNLLPYNLLTYNS